MDTTLTLLPPALVYHHPQFKVDDVAASPSVADAWNAVPPTPNASGQDLAAPAQRAYSRAVCLSFGGNAPAAKTALKEEGGLELKVRC